MQYHLTPEPVLVGLGKPGRLTVRASVPFFVGSTLHCPDYVHTVDTGRRAVAVFRATGGAPSGVLQVWAGK